MLKILHRPLIPLGVLKEEKRESQISLALSEK
jgi:hypothetical protein